MFLHAPRGPEAPPDQTPEWWASGNRRRVGHPARSEARKGLASARPVLENSTACRKSLPSSNAVRGSFRPCRWGFLGVVDSERLHFSVLSSDQIIYGEFDPGSGRRLAA